MRVVELSITNFRSFNGTTKIPFATACTAIVGPNNSGKSSILTALDWTIGSRYPYQIRTDATDYFETSKPIEIIATLGEINSDDKSKLMSLCQTQKQRGALLKNDNPEITIKLTIPVNAEYTDSEDIDEENLRGKPDLEIKLWNFSVFKKQADLRAKLLSYLLVSPQRRIDDELSASQWTQYGQLMKSVLTQSSQFNNLKKLLSDVNAGIQEAFAEQKEQLLDGARVVSYVEDINFRLTKDNNPVELLRNLEIFIQENGNSINLEKLGTGTQSAVIIGMMELVLNNKNGNSRLFAIEEPDVFIHPHGIRHLGMLLGKVSSNSNTQVIFSTHSPSLVATLEPASIIRVEKTEKESKIYCSKGSLDNKEYRRFLNQDNAEMFFARRVVLVEGATERFLLPPVSSILESNSESLDLNKRHISIINIDGKTSLIKYIKLVKDFDIEVVAILDNDFLGDSTCKKLVEYLILNGKQIDDSDNEKLRSSLLKQGIFVLSKGEIEDYIPTDVVVTITGKDDNSVSNAISLQSKTSDAFKKLFNTSKPQYAQLIAEHIVKTGIVPQDLERMIKGITSSSNPVP